MQTVVLEKFKNILPMILQMALKDSSLNLSTTILEIRQMGVDTQGANFNES